MRDSRKRFVGCCGGVGIARGGDWKWGGKSVTVRVRGGIDKKGGNLLGWQKCELGRRKR